MGFGVGENGEFNLYKVEGVVLKWSLQGMEGKLVQSGHEMDTYRCHLERKWESSGRRGS